MPCAATARSWTAGGGSCRENRRQGRALPGPARDEAPLDRRPAGAASTPPGTRPTQPRAAPPHGTPGPAQRDGCVTPRRTTPPADPRFVPRRRTRLSCRAGHTTSHRPECHAFPARNSRMETPVPARCDGRVLPRRTPCLDPPRRTQVPGKAGKAGLRPDPQRAGRSFDPGTEGKESRDLHGCVRQRSPCPFRLPRPRRLRQRDPRHRHRHAAHLHRRQHLAERQERHRRRDRRHPVSVKGVAARVS